MNVAIIFHSVCGHTYLLGRAFQDGLSSAGCKTSLYRVSDHDWVSKPDVPESARKVLAQMQNTPEASPNDLLAADLIIIGSPTYFGNVTAEMKAFMDSTGGLWAQGKLVGKKIFAYATAGHVEGGGDLCLQAIHTYGKYMGMLNVSLPVTALPGENLPALGVISYSAEKYAETIEARTERIIHACCSYFKSLK